MMQVGIVRVAVHQASMPVRVGVWLASIRGLVRMLVMLVMDVHVRVLQRFMGVLVLMPLGEMQPNAYGH